MSKLHFFFEHHGLGEKKLFLHADNCTGQNKNNRCYIQYLAWRAMTGLHTQITLSFMVVGAYQILASQVLWPAQAAIEVGSLQAIA